MHTCTITPAGQNALLLLLCILYFKESNYFLHQYTITGIYFS